MNKLKPNRGLLRLAAMWLMAMLAIVGAGAQSIEDNDGVITYAGFNSGDNDGSDYKIEYLTIDAYHHRNLFNGDNSYCWRCMSGGKSVPPGETDACYWVDFNADEPIQVASYVLTSSNDIQNHWWYEPKAWVLKGKLNENDSWSTIATVTNSHMSSQNSYDYNYALDAPGTYKFFRFMVSEVAAFDEAVELGELRLRNKIILPKPTGLSALQSYEGGVISTTLGWEAEGEATSWQICIDDNPDEDDYINVTSNSYSPTSLEPECTHFFKVRSLSEYGQSDWSYNCFFVPVENQAFSVYDGSGTSQFAPIFGSFTQYSSMTKSQFIIPSDKLQLPSTDCYISRLVFYAQESDVDWGTARFKVYVGETTDKTYFSSGDDFVNNNLTNVFEGALVVENHAMHVFFDIPYQYQGGNLVIGFYQTDVGNGSHTTWYGNEVHNYNQFPTHYNYSGSSANSEFIPRTTIVYSATPPSILRPYDLSYTLTQGDGTVATLSWTERSDATSWEICLDDGEDNLILLTDQNPYELTGLIPETNYTVKVRSVKGQERSRWSEAVTFKPTDNCWLTVNEGTDINETIPIKGRAHYSSVISTSQFIIPYPFSALSSPITDCYINRLAFYANDIAYDWGDAEFEVYLGRTNIIKFSQNDPSLIDWEDFTKVYTGSLSVSGYIMEITFDTPYHYEGGNLLIGVKQTKDGEPVASHWLGDNQSAHTAISGYSYRTDQSPYLSHVDFLPKTTISYTLEDPRAIKIPKDLNVIYTGGNSANVSWYSSETDWDIMVNGEVTEHVTSPYTLTNLAYAMDYEVKVRSRRDSDGTISVWTEPVSFSTALAADSCLIDFYLTDARGDGWTGNAIKVVDVQTEREIATVANDSETSAGEEQWIVVYVPKKRNFRLEWVKGENPEDCSWRVLDLNGDEISSCDAGDASSFESGYEIVVASTDCTVSTWKKPTNLTVHPYLSMAEISWTENSNPAATSWILAYKTIDDTYFTHEKWVSDNPYTLTGLEPNTTYIVKVRPYSGDDSVAKWSKEVTFTMYDEYMIPENLSAEIDENEHKATLTWSGNSAQYVVRYRKVYNFFEDFKNGIPSTWTTIDADGDGHNWYLYTYDADPVNEEPDEELMNLGPNFLASESYSDDDGTLEPDNWLITPLISLQGTMKVKLRSFSDDYPEYFAIYLSTSGRNESDFTVVLVPKTETYGAFDEYTYNFDLSSYSGAVGYIAIRHFDSTDQIMLLVNKFGLYETNEWSTITVDSPQVLIEDLSANSLYEFKVQGFSEDLPDGTESSEACQFFSYYGETNPIIKGDVNGDGVLNVEDVTALVNIIQGRDKPEYNYNYNAADVNSDGKYNVEDVTLLINKIQGRY